MSSYTRPSELAKKREKLKKRKYRDPDEDEDEATIAEQSKVDGDVVVEYEIYKVRPRPSQSTWEGNRSLLYLGWVLLGIRRVGRMKGSRSTIRGCASSSSSTLKEASTSTMTTIGGRWQSCECSFRFFVCALRKLTSPSTG